MTEKLRICKLTPEAKIPTRAYDHDVGYDLYSHEDHEIQPGEHAVIGTGLKMILPKGCAGLIWDKSGIAVKHGVKTKAGVIDPGYRGEWKVCLMNLSKNPFKVEKGMKIAQLLIQKVEHPEFEEIDNLDEADRGAGGFGSSGK